MAQEVTALEQAVTFWENNQDRLIEQYEGKWLLITQDDVVGDFVLPDQVAELTAAYVARQPDALIRCAVHEPASTGLPNTEETGLPTGQPSLFLTDELLRQAVRPMTPEEKHAQKVSFVMGMMSSRSTASREQIEKWLREME